MTPEVSLIAVLLVVFLYDLIAKGSARRIFNGLATVLMVAHVATLGLQLATGADATLFGGMYESNAASTVVKMILSLGTIIVMMQSNIWLKREDTNHKEGEFYVLLLSTLVGMYFMISARHFLLFFLGLELASIPMAALVAFDKFKKISAEAGAKFILCATFSSAFMLYGISLLYGTTGSLYFEDVCSNLTGAPLQILALVAFFSGLGFKISLVPFHFWTADSYQGAPTNVTSYLSVVSKGAAAFSLLTIVIKAFGPMLLEMQYILYVVIILSITIANLFAIRQTDLKRFMAFSSISQAGYIMLAVVGAEEPMGMTSLVFYVLVYVVANLSVFGVINVIEQKGGRGVEMDTYNGLYKTNPKLSFLMTLALFSLAGIPPFAGFFSKFFVFMSAFQAGEMFWPLVFIALVNTVISLYYYLLIVKAMYINPSDEPIATFKSDVCTRISLAVCTAGIVLLGLASCIYDAINSVSFGM